MRLKDFSLADWNSSPIHRRCFLRDKNGLMTRSAGIFANVLLAGPIIFGWPKTWVGQMIGGGNLCQNRNTKACRQKADSQNRDDKGKQKLLNADRPHPKN